MDCPNSKTLVDLLHNETPLANAFTVWEHFEDCQRCRLELDRLSDDPELQKWRNARSLQSTLPAETKQCASLVDRLIDQYTFASTIVAGSTVNEHAIEEDVTCLFQTSTFPDDLGTLGPYRILETLGSGGSATVFKALDTELHRVVALKILRNRNADALSRERFLQEAQALAGINHPNVVAVFGISATENGIPYISMEWVDGESLQQKIQRDKEVETKQAARWIAEIAEGLSAAHAVGLVHRDIKPSNVLIAGREEKAVAKLADFGLARFTSLAQNLTQTGVLLGTPSYMSPEHISAPESCDERSDVYGLGVTFYEMLTGELPFRGAVHTVLQKIGRDEPPAPRTLNTMIPRDLETICLKAIHREPQRRYKSSKSLADDLNRWLQGIPIQARPATRFEKIASWYRLNRSIALLGALIASLLLTLSAVSTYSAISIRNAGQLLLKEKAAVEETGAQLQIAADEAQKQRSIAIESLNSMVTKVQSELSNRSGTLKVRQAILDVALEGLDKITQYSDESKISPTLIQAYIRKGEIFDSLGRSGDSAVQLARAAKLSQSFAVQSPENADAQRELGNALIAQADIATRRGALDIAMPLYEKVLPIREAAAACFPKDFNSQKNLALVLQRIGDVHNHRSEWEDAQPIFARALIICQQNAALSESAIAQRDLSLAQQRIGMTESLRGRVAEAEKHFQEALAINRALLVADLGNKIYGGDLGYILGTLSKLTSSQGDHELAATQALESIAQCESVSNTDLDDTDAKMKAAMSWTHLYYVRMTEGKYIEACDAINAFLDRNAKLADENSSAAKFPMLSALWLDTLSSVQVRLGKHDDAALSLENSIGYLKRCQQAVDSKPESFEPMIAAQKTTLAGWRLAMSGIDDPELENKVEPDVLYTARIATIYQVARQGKLDRVIEISKLLKIKPTNNLPLLQSGRLFAARAFALCHGHLQKPADSTLKSEQMDRALHGAINHLKPIVSEAIASKNLGMLVTLSQERDFDSIRELPEFRSLLTNSK